MTLKSKKLRLGSCCYFWTLWSFCTHIKGKLEHRLICMLLWIRDALTARSYQDDGFSQATGCVCSRYLHSASIHVGHCPCLTDYLIIWISYQHISIKINFVVIWIETKTFKKSPPPLWMFYLKRPYFSSKDGVWIQNEGSLTLLPAIFSSPWSPEQSPLSILELTALLTFRVVISIFSPGVDRAMWCFLAISPSLALLLVLSNLWLSVSPIELAALGAEPLRWMPLPDTWAKCSAALDTSLLQQTPGQPGKLTLNSPLLSCACPAHGCGCSLQCSHLPD